MCTTKESSLEWIDFDLELFMFNIQNAKLVYEQNVMPEILCRTLKTDIEIAQDVKQNVFGCMYVYVCIYIFFVFMYLYIYKFIVKIMYIV